MPAAISAWVSPAATPAAIASLCSSMSLPGLAAPALLTTFTGPPIQPCRISMPAAPTHLPMVCLDGPHAASACLRVAPAITVDTARALTSSAYIIAPILPLPVVR